MPALPPGLAYLWEVFLDLNSARSSGGMSASALTFQDIAAWQQCHGVRLTSWEIQTLKHIDASALETVTENK